VTPLPGADAPPGRASPARPGARLGGRPDQRSSHRRGRRGWSREQPEHL